MTFSLPEKIVFLVALVASAYGFWARFGKVVEKIRAAKPDPEIRIDDGLVGETLDPSLGLQPADRLDRVRAGQPVDGRERVTLPIVGRVADDERVTVRATGHDRELGVRRAAELGGDGGEVGGAGDVRRPSRVRGGDGPGGSALSAACARRSA